MISALVIPSHIIRGPELHHSFVAQGIGRALCRGIQTAALITITLRSVNYDCLVPCLESEAPALGAKCPTIISALQVPLCRKYVRLWGGPCRISDLAQVSKCKRIIAEKCKHCVSIDEYGSVINSSLTCLMPCWQDNVALLDAVCAWTCWPKTGIELGSQQRPAPSLASQTCPIPRSLQDALECGEVVKKHCGHCLQPSQPDVTCFQECLAGIHSGPGARPSYAQPDSRL
jgi:hypothetical protein